MGTVIEILVVMAIIIGLAWWGIGEIKYKAECMKNTLMGEKGYCKYCKYCVRDEKGEKTGKHPTGYYCRLSKRDNITEITVMDCMEKPKIKEADLEELFLLGIWNEDGKTYIRESLLGKRMIYPELDEFLKDLAQKYPEYLTKQM